MNLNLLLGFSGLALNNLTGQSLLGGVSPPFFGRTLKNQVLSQGLRKNLLYSYALTNLNFSGVK